MREAQDVTIDGESYTITMMPAGKASKMLVRLGKVFGGSVGGLFKNKDTDVEEAIGPAIEGIFANMSEEMFDKTSRELVDCALYNGSKIAYDVHFAGRLLLLMKVLKEVLKVNYHDFFDGFKNVKELLTVVPKKAKSTGRSGG